MSFSSSAGWSLLAAVGAAVARAIEYRGAAKPGVSVLGDRRRRQVARRGRACAARRGRARPVTIRAGGRSYHVPRGWLVSVDARATAARALSAGSPVALVVPLHQEVAPVLARAGGAGDVLRQIARAERPAGLGGGDAARATVVVTPARIGRRSTGQRCSICCRRRGHDRRAVRAAAARDPRSRGAQRRLDGARLARSAGRARLPRCAARVAHAELQLAHALRDQTAQASVRSRVRSRVARAGSCVRGWPLDRPRAQRAVRRRR